MICSTFIRPTHPNTPGIDVATSAFQDQILPWISSDRNVVKSSPSSLLLLSLLLLSSLLLSSSLFSLSSSSSSSWSSSSSLSRYFSRRPEKKPTLSLSSVGGAFDRSLISRTDTDASKWPPLDKRWSAQPMISFSKEGTGRWFLSEKMTDLGLALHLPLQIVSWPYISGSCLFIWLSASLLIGVTWLFLCSRQEHSCPCSEGESNSGPLELAQTDQETDQVIQAYLNSWA